MTNIPLKAGQTRWKYRVVKLRDISSRELDEFGAYGWELVSATDALLLIFKRPEATAHYKEIAEAAIDLVHEAVERCAHAADEWAKDHNVVPQGVLGDRIREAGRRLPP